MHIFYSHNLFKGHNFFGGKRAMKFFGGHPDVYHSTEAARFFKYHASVFVDVCAAGEWARMYGCVFVCIYGV